LTPRIASATSLSGTSAST